MFGLNLAKDPQEQKNLVATMPAKAAELEAKIVAWEKEVAAPRLREFVVTAGGGPRSVSGAGQN